ncbi:MAG: hypothetical protein KGD59_12250 [Candidatus Heimdallarchaeota archaeon]|nr:hypothetical protein [Candidatus Heimdallarchaeota archaeon]MBY8995315.1 hypothetical protein [Candidatus Heimdallarchaeota archaeon]
MVVLREANTFLIQVDSTRKNYLPSNFTNIPGEPIFAEDVLLHNRFKLDEESITNNPDFHKVNTDNYLLVFCNSLVPHSPNQIKFIFKVVNKLGNQMVLKLFTKLKRGYTLNHIKSLVEEGKLSKEMLNCGTKGFKVCQVNFSDLELLVNFDPLVRTYHSTSWKN